jgi:hypothetical protein
VSVEVKTRKGGKNGCAAHLWQRSWYLGNDMQKKCSSQLEGWLVGEEVEPTMCIIPNKSELNTLNQVVESTRDLT